MIPSDDVNVVRDIAYCRRCNLVHELRTLADGAELEALGGSPPPETWCRRAETETAIGALHYSPVIMGVSLVLGLVWSAVLFPVAKELLRGLTHNAGLRVEDGHPASRVIAYATRGEDAFGVFLFLGFLLISCPLLGAFLSCVAGRTEVTIRGVEGEVFVGVGRFGRRLRFDPRRVTNVRIGRPTNNGNDPSLLLVIELSDGKWFEFGSLLPASRRRYLAGALHEALIGRK